MPANHTTAFSAVAAEGVSRSDYRADLHERVDGYVNDWVSGGFRWGDESDRGGFLGAPIRNCTRYVMGRERANYGSGLLGWITFMFAKALISYLVERTLRELFGGTGAAA